MKILAATAALTICFSGVVISACGVANSEQWSDLPPEREPWPVMAIDGYQVEASDGKRPPNHLLEHVESEDGGVLRWYEEEDGEVYGYERRVKASDPNADENRLPWDMERVGNTPPEGWKVEDYID